MRLVSIRRSKIVAARTNLSAGRISPGWQSWKQGRRIRNPERRGDLYRRAGDLYATEQGDLSSALRCYSESLDAGNEKDLTISTDDHWLLMAIKDARQKEKNDARTSH